MSSARALIHHYGDTSKLLFAPMQIGKIYGAELDGATINIALNTSAGQKVIQLSKTAKPFTVMIRYKCCDVASTETDFERFYEILELPTKHVRTDLTFETAEDPYLHRCERQLLDTFGEEGRPEKQLKDTHSASLIGLVNNLRKAREACEGAVLPECPNNLEGNPEDC